VVFVETVLEPDADDVDCVTVPLTDTTVDGCLSKLDAARGAGGGAPYACVVVDPADVGPIVVPLDVLIDDETAATVDDG
jgi:hypothetical protein